MDISTGRSLMKPVKRVRSPERVRDYREIREGLRCEYCRMRLATELNHILHGSQKQDGFWNFVFVCNPCHQDPVFGFHGSKPTWDVEKSLRMKAAQGFTLPRSAYAYLEGIDTWPGHEPVPHEERELAVLLAEKERRC